MPTTVELLTQRQVAERFAVSISLLRKWRREGGGPPFVRFGSRLVRYRPEDLEKWADQGLRQSAIGRVHPKDKEAGDAER